MSRSMGNAEGPRCLPKIDCLDGGFGVLKMNWSSRRKDPFVGCTME
jgi:hypothetical protein